MRVIVQHAQSVTREFEVIVVDDGSADGSWDVIVRESQQIAGMRGLRLSRNFGKEAAMFAGLAESGGRAVIVIDGDLQHPPEMIPSFVEIWRRGGVDVVDGVRRGGFGNTIRRRASSHVFNRVIAALTGYDFRGNSDYKLLDRRVVSALLQMDERRTFFRGLVEWTGFRHQAITYEVAPRRAGGSRWTTAALVRLAGRAIISYSAFPLR